LLLGLSGGKVPLICQMVQEGFYFRPAHGVRVALPVEIDELPNPVTIAVFGAGAEMTPAAYDRNLIHQAGWGGLTP